MLVYIAGPMRGLPEFNFPTFFAVEKSLQCLGHETRNPARNDCEAYPNIKEWAGYQTGNVDLCPEFDFHKAMRWDLRQILEVDAICLLPGWEQSTGAKHEKYVADIFCLPVMLARHVAHGWAYEVMK